jgi:hypothetical protein
MKATRSFDEGLAELARRPRRPFHPCAFYNRLGDAIEIYLKDDAYVAERINPLFSIFVSAKDPSQVVGLAIKNIRKHLKKSGVSEVFTKVHGRATVKTFVLGALLAVEVTLHDSPKQRQEVNREFRERIRPIIDQVGEKEVKVEKNVRELVGSP